MGCAVIRTIFSYFISDFLLNPCTIFIHSPDNLCVYPFESNFQLKVLFTIKFPFICHIIYYSIYFVTIFDAIGNKNLEKLLFNLFLLFGFLRKKCFLNQHLVINSSV